MHLGNVNCCCGVTKIIKTTNVCNCEIFNNLFDELVYVCLLICCLTYWKQHTYHFEICFLTKNTHEHITLFFVWGNSETPAFFCQCVCVLLFVFSILFVFLENRNMTLCVLEQMEFDNLYIWNLSTCVFFATVRFWNI